MNCARQTSRRRRFESLRTYALDAVTGFNRGSSYNSKTE